MAEPGTFIGEVQRGWQRFWRLSWWWKGPILGVIGLIAIGTVGAIAGGGEDKPKDEAGAERATAAATRTTAPTRAPVPTTTAPTPTPAPTPPPTAPPTPVPPPPPVELSGFGQTATDPVTPPCPICRATLTHSGSSNFIVHTFRGAEEDFLVNEIGAYQGSRPIFGEEPIVFDIDADGAWSIRIEQVGTGGQPPFAGRGDAVSDLFSPPSTGPWEFVHDGQSNFIVWFHCAGGSDGIQNEIGPVSGSGVVAFDSGPCLWEVEADGNWSLTPR